MHVQVKYRLLSGPPCRGDQVGAVGINGSPNRFCHTLRGSSELANQERGRFEEVRDVVARHDEGVAWRGRIEWKERDRRVVLIDKPCFTRFRNDIAKRTAGYAVHFAKVTQ